MKYNRFIIGFLALFMFLHTQFAKADETDVKNFMNNVAQQIIKTVTSTSTSNDEKANQLLDIIKTNFDTQWMAKFALGREYRNLSNDNQQKYESLYNIYLKNTYFPILMKYNHQSYTITKVVKTGTNLYSVSLVIAKSTQNDAIDLTYTVKNNDGKYQLLDMAVEGVSTVFTQKSEFSSILQDSGIDGLFNKLSKSTA